MDHIDQSTNHDQGTTPPESQSQWLEFARVAAFTRTRADRRRHGYLQLDAIDGSGTCARIAGWRPRGGDDVVESWRRIGLGAAIARIVLNRARGLRGGFARRVVDDGRGVGDCGVACVCVCV